jgi:hypothetical protein
MPWRPPGPSSVWVLAAVHGVMEFPAKLASHVASDIVSRRSRHVVSRHCPYPKNRSHPFHLLRLCLILFRRSPSASADHYHIPFLLKRPCLSSLFLHLPTQVLHRATRLHPNPTTATPSPSRRLQWAAAPPTTTMRWASMASAN